LEAGGTVPTIPVLERIAVALETGRAWVFGSDAFRAAARRYSVSVSGERDELRRLVEELPDEQLPAALTALRQRLALVPLAREASWPPEFFNSITADRDDIGRSHEDLLAEGFGRD
jgi:hypothetical protein